MILPSTIKLEAVIGTTFDLTTIFYPAEYGNLVWKKPNLWFATIQYEVNNAILGSDSNAYKCLVGNININPVGDTSGHWEKLTPLNNTGYKAEMRFGEELTLESGGKGITLGGSTGSVYIEAKPEQTEKFNEGPMDIAILMTNTEEKKYEYLNGSIKWKKQLI